MPLLDHFHPPLDRLHPWKSFHSAWAASITRLLNAGVLPEGYYAAPNLDRGGPVEIDVAALGGPELPDGSFARQWSPDAPAAAVAVEWPDADAIEVEIFSRDGDPPLVAAIELVSPANKDRPTARQAFAEKCADYLRHGCGVVVVDAVSTRRANLHDALLAELGAEPFPAGGSLSVVAYRSLGGETDGRLEVWPAALELGRSLPTVPLWLGGEFAVPLDLEASYSATCADLRIRRAG